MKRWIDSDIVRGSQHILVTPPKPEAGAFAINERLHAVCVFEHATGESFYRINNHPFLATNWSEQIPLGRLSSAEELKRLVEVLTRMEGSV